MSKEFMLILIFGSIQVWYCIFLLRNIFYWNQLKTGDYDSSHTPVIAVSVVVAVRNEALTISTLLESLFSQKYPSSLFEIIIVNDHSEDQTTEIVHSMAKAKNSLRLISLTDETGKKAAIKKGVIAAKGELIITTDGDCQMSDNWISVIVDAYESKKPFLICSPVFIKLPANTLEHIQDVEYQTLMGFTGASIKGNAPILANGANLAFSKEFFMSILPEIKGAGNSSGDDMFLMLAAKKTFSNKILFLKNSHAAVFTNACSDLSSLTRQRRRWASKSLNYEDRDLLRISALIFLHHTSLLISLLFSFFYNSFAFLLLIQLLTKMVVEFKFYNSIASDFNFPKKYTWVALYSLVYNPIMGVISLTGISKKYIWKGRRVS